MRVIASCFSFLVLQAPNRYRCMRNRMYGGVRGGKRENRRQTPTISVYLLLDSIRKKSGSLSKVGLLNF